MAALLLLLLAAAPGPAASGELASATTGCATDLDCELTGSCDTASGRCRCYPGWIGPTCGTLDLLPAPRRGAWPAQRPVPPEYWGDGATPVSWGGTIGSPMSAADSRWHMVVDTGCYNPGRTMHMDGFQLSQAVSDLPEGPYTFVGPAIAGTTHYNPHMTEMPDGRWLLFFCGEPTPRLDFGVSACTGNETANPPAAPNPPLGAGNCSVDDCFSAFCEGWGDRGKVGAEVGAPNNATCLAAGCAWDPGFAACMPPQWSSPRRSQIKVAIANSPAGPWKNITEVPLTRNAADLAGNPGFVDNPTALVTADAKSPSGYRVTLAYRFPGNDTDCSHPRCSPSVIGLASATDWRGPYTTISDLQWPGRKAVLPYIGLHWAGPFTGGGCEDPTLFAGRNGSVHMLVHKYEDDAPPGWPGLHAFSPDGSPGSWRVSNSPDGRGAYSYNISWEDGGCTVFRRRERPQLVTSPATGDPTLLVTGLEYQPSVPPPASRGGPAEYSFTLVQSIRAAPPPTD